MRAQPTQLNFAPVWRTAAVAALMALLGLLAHHGRVTAQTTAPVAAVREVTDELHGVTVKDPYRYFENTKTPEVQTWLKAQGAVAREALDALPMRAQLLERVSELGKISGDSVRDVVRMPGEHIYYLKRIQGGKQFKLMLRVGADGPERVLVDPELDAQRTGVPHAVNYFVPAWDNRHVAYGMSAGGSEDASLFILNIATGRLVGKPIPRVHESLVNWHPNSQSFSFNQIKVPKPGESETEKFLDSRVLWLKLGQAERQALPIFGPTVNRRLGLARLDVGAVIFNPTSRWMIARTTDTTLPEGFLFVAPLASLGRGVVPWRKISGYADKITAIELRGDELYFLSYDNAPRKRVRKLDLNNPVLGNAVEAAATPANGVMEDFTLTKTEVIAAVRQGTDIVLRRYGAGDPLGQAIPLPFKGAARIHDEPARSTNAVFYTLSGWTTPARTYQWDGAGSSPVALRANVPALNLPELTITDVEVPSHDGALVPMTVLHAKGLVLDGSNPTLLNAYAAYGFSETAGFSAASFAWLEQGGVLAYANVRGSGVYGTPWYRAGFKATKSNTWKDGIACAQYLIEKGYASPKTLGVAGTSAGGIFVGRAVTTAPQLFAAAIFNVGVMDAVRAEESANGITNISEFGSYKNAAEFPALLEMSTYHQIKDGVHYPAVMLVHGINDPRVDVWHSAKVAARLQAAIAGNAPQHKKPVLLRLDMLAGHGVGSTATQRDAQTADVYSFLLSQMGRTLKP